jgi:GxxExxY protein
MLNDRLLATDESDKTDTESVFIRFIRGYRFSCEISDTEITLTGMEPEEFRVLESITERVLGAAFEVSNTLGAGFLEKVYVRALLRELALRGVTVVHQAPFEVSYKGYCVGEYFADLLVEDAVLVEVKCADRFASEHFAQCMNYLRASGLNVCLLINFQKPKIEWKRVLSGFQIEELREVRVSSRP